MTFFEEPVSMSPAMAENDNSPITVRANPESKRAFREKAATKGMSMSTAAREALRDWMAKE